MVGKQILLPIAKGLVFVFNSPLVQKHRFRAVASLFSLLLAGFILLYLIPVPAYTRSEGVIWMPEDAQLRVNVDGFAGELKLELPTKVTKDTTVIEVYDPLLNTKVEVLYAQLKELNSKFRAEWNNDRIKADNIKEEMLVVAEELKHAKKNQQAMLIVSKKSGNLLIPEVDDLTGRFLRKGEIIGYVIDDALPTVRVVVTQSDIGQIQQQVKGVEIRLVNQPALIMPAKIIRRAPEGTNYLPNPALATINGGKIPIDPDYKDELKTLEKVFHIDLEFKSTTIIPQIGQRVYVRFDHGTEPLMHQWFRSIRQVFLRQFNV
jgi:putative peptide zinc metalloprotease protein